MHGTSSELKINSLQQSIAQAVYGERDLEIAGQRINVTRTEPVKKVSGGQSKSVVVEQHSLAEKIVAQEKSSDFKKILRLE